MVRQRPELTMLFKGIDGISTEQKREKDQDMGGHWTTPAKKAIRDDVLVILQMPQIEFDAWIKQKNESVDVLLALYEAAGSVPNLAHGTDGATFGSTKTVFKELIDELRYAKKHLDLIAKIRKEDFS
ncbi:MAG: hypothetical protein WCI36_05320 [bacterium]